MAFFVFVDMAYSLRCHLLVRYLFLSSDLYYFNTFLMLSLRIHSAEGQHAGKGSGRKEGWRGKINGKKEEGKGKVPPYHFCKLHCAVIVQQLNQLTVGLWI